MRIFQVHFVPNYVYMCVIMYKNAHKCAYFRCILYLIITLPSLSLPTNGGLTNNLKSITTTQIETIHIVTFTGDIIYLKSTSYISIKFETSIIRVFILNVYTYNTEYNKNLCTLEIFYCYLHSALQCSCQRRPRFWFDPRDNAYFFFFYVTLKHSNQIKYFQLLCTMYENTVKKNIEDLGSIPRQRKKIF